MGILSGLKARLAGKPTFEQFERKTVGLPPEQAAPLWVEFAKDHEELKPDEATYGYRRAASLYRQLRDTDKYVEQSLNYARTAESVPDYAIAGEGYRVVAENRKENAEQYWAKAGENYNKAGQKAEEDRFTTRAGDMYTLAATSYERAGEYQKAIENYLKSTAISERKKHLERVARDYGKVAENYLRLKEYEKAADYFLQHAEAETSRAHVAYSDGFFRAGRSFVKAGMIDKAAEAFMKHAEFSGEPAYGFRNAAECYQQLGDKDKALELYLKEVEDDLSKSREFVAKEVLKLAAAAAPDNADIRKKVAAVTVPTGFERASAALRETIKRELEEKGLPVDAIAS